MLQSVKLDIKLEPGVKPWSAEWLKLQVTWMNTEACVFLHRFLPRSAPNSWNNCMHAPKTRLGAIFFSELSCLSNRVTASYLCLVFALFRGQCEHFADWPLFTEGPKEGS